MNKYKYKAKDKNGRVVAGNMQALSEVAVKKQLSAWQLRPINIKATKLSKSSSKPVEGEEMLGGMLVRDENGVWQIDSGPKKPSTKDITVFTKQFSTMLNSGVPMIQSLDILADQQKVRNFSKTIKNIKSVVENGSSLSEALEAFPAIFEELYVAMVQAGEQSGNLDVILGKLVIYIEKAAKLKSQVKAALFYPLAIMVVSVIVVTILMVFVVPVFAKQYEGSDRAMPGMTQIVINISDFFTAQWYVMIGTTVIGGFVLGKVLKTDQGRAKFDKLLLTMPILGKLMQKIAVGRFCQTMSTMLQSGVSILDALKICASTSGNMVIESFVNRVRQKISEGSSFSAPLKEETMFPDMVVSMVEIGEKTGSLDDMLKKVSEFYEEEVDAAVEAMLSMIEPVMMIVLGGIIGFIVVAMYLPVFDMGNLVG